MDPEPISHPEVFFEVLFCPNLQTRAMGGLSLHSLYWLHYSEQSPWGCFATVALCVWFRHLKSQLLPLFPIDLHVLLHRFFLQLFCTHRANENWYKIN